MILLCYGNPIRETEKKRLENEIKGYIEESHCNWGLCRITELHSARFSCSRHQNYSSYNKLSCFSVASTDHFSFKDAAYVGDITAITLKRDEAGWFPKWQLARVRSNDSFIFENFLYYSILFSIFSPLLAASNPYFVSFEITDLKAN